MTKAMTPMQNFATFAICTENDVGEMITIEIILQVCRQTHLEEKKVKSKCWNVADLIHSKRMNQNKNDKYTVKL